MRKLFILTIFISSLMMTSMAHAEWTKVVVTKKGYTHYVDFERIRKHDGKVYYWELIDLLKPHASGVISAKLYTEVECGRFGYRWLKFTLYKGPMASGKIYSSLNTPQKDWNYPPPNTGTEVVLEAVCKPKP
ncbi:hypothetical protein OAN59_11935 [Alphaproteobacteria bacterium]|nr:hypothetical protein [Alphaproteobacteria bacterium]